jgi:uncharacterized protein YvpB/LysM repeat protein
LYQFNMHNFAISLIKLILVAGLVLSPGSGIPVFGEDLPESAAIAGFTGRPQKHNLSCEARSAADWATFLGTRIGENEILAALPRSDNPEIGFVGSPDGVWGLIPPRAYGVYPAALASALQSFRIAARAVRGMNWDDIRAEIAQNRPVIVWVIGQMWTAAPIEYQAKEGPKTVVAHFEHTMTVIGYTASSVQVFDAYSGMTMTFLKGTFLASWRVLGNLAIVYDPRVLTVEPPSPTPVVEPAAPTQPPAAPQDPSVEVPTRAPTPTLAPAQAQSIPQTPSTGFDSQLSPTAQVQENKQIQTVLVKTGDTLIAIAEQYNVSWQEIAEFNRLTYPYFLETGQMLRLPAGGDARPLPPANQLPAPTQPQATLTPTPGPASTNTPASTAPAAQVPENMDKPSVFVVQRGDFLIGLAKKFGMDWRQLAQINGIGYPFIIYPGQVLKLR